MHDKPLKEKNDEILKDMNSKDAETLRKEFMEMVESKLKREEKDIWFVKNHEHLKISTRRHL